MKTAEEIILQTLLLKAHLQKLGVYDEVIEAMKAYAEQAIERCAEIADTTIYNETQVVQMILDLKQQLK